MSKHTKLMNFLSNMPDFVFDYIEIAYSGESINTQIGYSIDIKTFLEYLQKFKFRDIKNLEDFTLAHMEKVTLRDLNAFTAYLKLLDDLALFFKCLKRRLIDEMVFHSLGLALSHRPRCVQNDRLKLRIILLDLSVDLIFPGRTLSHDVKNAGHVRILLC